MSQIKVLTKEESSIINPELHGQFIEFLGSGIYDGIWVGEDSDIPNYDGLRKDVVDALKKLNPPILRWPGGCFADVYHWRDGVGPRIKRPKYFNENFGTMKIEKNDFGTHEFMQLCEIVGAKPWFNINMMTGTTAEAREWAEYVNNEAGTSLAEERSSNGHSEPFDVEYWGIGNESWAGGGNYTAQSYADEYRKYTSSLPSFGVGLPWVDTDKEMKMIAVGPDGNKPKERVEWTKDFFKELTKYRKPRIHGYDLHFYNWNLSDPTDTVTEFSEEAWYRLINGAFELEEVIKEQSFLVEEGLKEIPKEEGAFATELQVDLIVGEWGNWHNIDFSAPSILWQQSTMRDAITTALTLDIFHRNSDKVKMACIAQSVNVLNSLFLTQGKEMVLTPNYYVFELYKEHQNGRKINMHSSVKDISRGNEFSLKNIHSFASIKENIITLNLINISCDEEEVVELEFDNFVEYIGARELTGNNINSYNEFNKDESVTIKDLQFEKEFKEKFSLKLKPASVSVHQFKLATGR